MNTDEIRALVASILESSNIAFSVRYVGQAVKDEWECDAWRVTFTISPKLQYGFDFFTGLGCRRVPIRWEGQRERLFIEQRTCPNRKSMFWHGLQKQMDELKKPVAPVPADILHSLFLDASASDNNFKDWCSDFGYSDDSIKALNTYKECLEIGEKLRMMFRGADIQEMREALQEY
jgi:hypothetical protein